jgi:hypothetical protein
VASEHDIAEHYLASERALAIEIDAPLSESTWKSQFELLSAALAVRSPPSRGPYG